MHFRCPWKNVTPDARIALPPPLEESCVAGWLVKTHFTGMCHGRCCKEGPRKMTGMARGSFYMTPPSAAVQPAYM